MSDKNWGETVLGWFVVRDRPGAGAGEPLPDMPPDMAISGAGAPDAAGSGAPGGGPAAGATPFVTAPPAAPEGKVDFPGVFSAAGIDDEEQSWVKKAADLLAALPEGSDPAIKKQIVEASLKAFGVPIDKIIEAGVQEIQALQGYIETGARDTQLVLDESQRRIAQYEDEIRQLRTVMDSRVAEQKAVIDSCNRGKLDIQGVLEFFGRDEVARVVSASPKLIDPSERKA
jgi:hypothetical protein